MASLLLLEDDLALAMHYREALELKGHVVYHEVNVEQAKLTLQDVAIDIVISDIMIRDLSGAPSSRGGFSLISHIRLNIRPIPHIIVITGADSRLNLLQVAESFSAAAALEKPIDMDLLLAEVDRLLALPRDEGLSPVEFFRDVDEN